MTQLFEDYPHQWEMNSPVLTTIVSGNSTKTETHKIATSKAASDLSAPVTELKTAQDTPIVSLQPQRQKKKKDKKELIIDGQHFAGYVPFQKIKPDYVQIKAGTVDVLQRIKCYQARKRDEVNTENINEFCYDALRGKNQGCARVNSVVNIRSDCKSHIKVYRVFNAWGPQTRGVDPGSIPHPNPPDPACRLLQEQEDALIEKMCGTCGNSLTENCPETIHERLENAELHLKIDGPVPRDIYLRIKQIENRILELEGISPEYADKSADYVVRDDKPLEYTPLNKRGYSKYELKRRLTLLQNDLVMKRLKREKEDSKKEKNGKIKQETCSAEIKKEPTGKTKLEKSLEVKKEVVE